jgi:hypothetical protein
MKIQAASDSEELVLAGEDLGDRVVGEDAADRVGEGAGGREHGDVVRAPGRSGSVSVTTICSMPEFS